MLNDEVSGRFFDLRSSLVDGKARTAESTILYATIDIKIPFQRRFEREKVRGEFASSKSSAGSIWSCGCLARALLSELATEVTLSAPYSSR